MKFMFETLKMIKAWQPQSGTRTVFKNRVFRGFFAYFGVRNFAKSPKFREKSHYMYNNNNKLAV